MAKKVTVELIDDISGQSGATTTRFALDGIDYEIDLVDDQALRDVLAPYITKSRATNGGGKRAAGKKPVRPDLHRVRLWARQHGHEIPKRGRLPEALLRAYDKQRADASRADRAS